MTWLMEDEPTSCTPRVWTAPLPEDTLERPEFMADPPTRASSSPSPSRWSALSAYAGWGGKIDSEGVPLFQQALVGKLSSKEFLDKSPRCSREHDVVMHVKRRSRSRGPAAALPPRPGAADGLLLSDSGRPRARGTVLFPISRRCT